MHFTEPAKPTGPSTGRDTCGVGVLAAYDPPGFYALFYTLILRGLIAPRTLLSAGGREAR